MENIKEFVCLALLLILVCGNHTVVFASESEKFEDLRAEYFNCPEFMAHYNYDPVDAMRMLDQVFLSMSSHDFKQRTLPPDIYLVMDIVMQPNGHYCGPTSAYIAISAWNGLSSVSGSTVNEKIETLGTQMGTNASGTLVYRVRNCLNSYVTSCQYSYIKGSTINIGQFHWYLYNSLCNNRPPILHVKTESLPYYGDYSTGHYIAVEGKSLTDQTVTLYDSNNDPNYYGIHVVQITEAFAAIHDHRSRYLIYAE